MKKFVFCKVSDLQAYSCQQMNSLTGIFQRFYLDSKTTVLSPPCSPHVLTQAAPSSFEKHPPMEGQPPMFLTPVGNPVV